jgi:hypothetical protein
MRGYRVPSKSFISVNSNYFSKCCEKIGRSAIILCAAQLDREIHRSGRIHFSVVALQKKILARRVRKGL